MRLLAEDQNPKRVIRRLYVWRTLPGKAQAWIVCSKSLWGSWTHFLCSRTQPCYHSEEERDIVPDTFNHRWYGYMHVVSPTSGRQVFLEITENAKENLLRMLVDLGDLRGRSLECWREPDHKQGELCLRVNVNRSKSDTLPVEIHPKATLEWLWQRKLPAGLKAS